MEEYRVRAELAERQARRARNLEDREAFLEVARLWRNLAERGHDHGPQRPR
jgi:hypothetical protein